MRVSKTFRLSEEAVDVLNKQENATQFIEDLILGKLGSPGGENSTPQINTPTLLFEIEEMLRALLAEAVIELKESLKQKQTSTGFVPRPPDPDTGYPCCDKNTPCKHWAWDNVESLWKNTLTNKTREP